MSGVVGDKNGPDVILTTELLETAIRSKEGRSGIIVEDFHEDLTREGLPNFLSVPLFVTVYVDDNGIKKVHHLFIKAVRGNEEIKEIILVRHKFYLKEQMAYMDLIPDMIRCQTERGIEPIRPSVPVYYYSIANATAGVIVLEDVGPHGYALCDRQIGLDYEQCKLVLKEMAIFHALSFAIKNRDPDNLKKYESLFHESVVTSPLSPYLTNGLKMGAQLVKMVSNDVDINSCVERLLKIDLEKTLRDLIKPEEPYAVVCHGDLGPNNLLFQYSGENRQGTPDDVRLVDLQVVRYALPTTDLSYFLLFCTTRSLRKKHMNDMLHHYHSEFMKCLEQLKSDFPEFTFQVLETMYKESMLFGIIFAFMLLPHTLAKVEGLPPLPLDETKEADLDLVFHNFFKEILETESNITAIEERLIGILEDALEMGVI